MARLSRADRLSGALHELQSSVADIQASAIVSVDGLIIASALPSGAGEDRVAAMSAAMLSLGERIAQELGRGVLAHERAKLDLVFLEMRRAVERLVRLL